MEVASGRRWRLYGEEDASDQHIRLEIEVGSAEGIKLRSDKFDFEAQGWRSYSFKTFGHMSLEYQVHLKNFKIYMGGTRTTKEGYHTKTKG